MWKDYQSFDQNSRTISGKKIIAEVFGGGDAPL